jgi:hypothetical protein
MKGVIAIQKLSAMGYCFALKGDQVRYEWHGSGDPDPAQVRPLLAQVKANKSEVVDFLSKPAPREPILTCADCGFHEYQGPNPAHGWGRCTFKGKGCYGLRPACDEVHPQDTDGPLDG